MCRRLAFVSSACLLVAATACAPAFNWREGTIGTTALSTLFPCKPERVTRLVPIGTDEREVAMHSCDAGGVTFAVAHAGLADPVQAPAVLASWRASTLAGVHADPGTVSATPPQGLPALPQLQVVRASRAGGDGKPGLQLIGVWFAQDGDVFAAFVMGPAIPAEVAQTFFAGLRLQ